MFQESIFSFFITEKDIVDSRFPIKKKFGKYNVLVDEHTAYTAFSNANCECAIFGVAINVVTGESEKIVEKILTDCHCMQDVIEYEKQLGGKYILLYKNGENYYLQGDATCSIPVFYSVDDELVCSSSYKSILDVKEFSLYREYEIIRNSGEISQAMPYDITPCKEIKQLIPNHYLDMNNSKPLRFINSVCVQDQVSIADATRIVKPMIENMIDYYSSLFKIYCPITGGRDSRVILAFLMGKQKEFKCYTIKHPEHSNDAHDLVVSEDMCRKNSVPYELIKDITLTDELLEYANVLFGEGNYSVRTFRIAQTIKARFGDGAVLNGDIIGQVGKCSLHRDIPSVFATPAYFRCKLHNYSAEARKQLKYWLEEINSSGEKVNTFDLFSIENRMGRWAGQENMIYNSLGQLYLNVFNSRSIIYTWTSVRRDERKLSLVHTGLIKELCPRLSDFPYKNDASKIVRLSKSNGIMYLLSSYVKYYLDKKKFNEEK